MYVSNIKKPKHIAFPITMATAALVPFASAILAGLLGF